MTSRRIAPGYSFRFTAADIRRTYGSAEAAFTRGDFLNAAQVAPPDSELKGCSLVLGGLLEQGLLILDRLTTLSGRARLCRAFALWSLNRPSEAKAALKNNAYDYSPVDSFDTFIGELPNAEKPDILFSLSPQWLLAKDFHKVRVPKVVWCHDSDAFQYRNVSNYALYDAAICNCSQEHFELSQATPGLFCAANMLRH